jgi:hypothetical protein
MEFKKKNNSSKSGDFGTLFFSQNPLFCTQAFIYLFIYFWGVM